MMSRLLVVGLAMASAACAACAETTGTETGNPPAIAAQLIHVEAVDDDHVRVSGGPGAIDPGGGEVTITNTTRDGEPVVAKIDDDGSFSVELPGSPDDSYAVTATDASGGSSARSVVGGDGVDGGTMTVDWQTLHACDAADPSDPLTVTALQIEGDTLQLDVSHGGGCEQHHYGLCFEPVWAGSAPPQLGLRVLHDAGGDSCEALLTESLTFDLTAVRDAYAEQFGQGPGAVDLGFDACMLPGQAAGMCQVRYEWAEPDKPCGPPIGPDCPTFELPEAPPSWVVHETLCRFSFRGPDDLERTDVMGLDSCVDQLDNASCTFAPGSGGFSSGLTDIEEDGSDVVVGHSSIAGLDAKLLTASVAGEPRGFLAGVHFPHPPFEDASFGVSADLVIHCATAADRDAMLPVLGTVQFE